MADRRRNLKPPREAVPLQAVLAAVMKRLGLEDQHWLTVLAQEWPSIAGKAVAAHSRPGRVNDRHLVVFVDSSTWLNELSRYGKGRLLRNLQERLGPDRIASVSFRLDPDAGGRAP